MLLTQGVPYIDREELGLSYISCPSLLRFRGPRHENINPTSPSTLWITISTLASSSCGVLYIKFILIENRRKMTSG